MLKNKRVVVTGAAGTLGQAVARCAADYGADVIGLDVIAGYSSNSLAQYHQVDLTDREATANCIGALGEVDALLNIAGGFAMGTAASEPKRRRKCPTPGRSAASG